MDIKARGVARKTVAAAILLALPWLVAAQGQPCREVGAVVECNRISNNLANSEQKTGAGQAFSTIRQAVQAGSQGSAKSSAGQVFYGNRATPGGNGGGASIGGANTGGGMSGNFGQESNGGLIGPPGTVEVGVVMMAPAPNPYPAPVNSSPWKGTVTAMVVAIGAFIATCIALRAAASAGGIGLIGAGALLGMLLASLISAIVLAGILAFEYGQYLTAFAGMAAMLVAAMLLVGTPGPLLIIATAVTGLMALLKGGNKKSSSSVSTSGSDAMDPEVVQVQVVPGQPVGQPGQPVPGQPGLYAGNGPGTSPGQPGSQPGEMEPPSLERFL